MDDFEREKLCYEQNFEQMRSLNSMMWQVPAFAMTLTGGLWYGAGSLEHVPTLVKPLLLCFAGIANLLLIFVVQRVRSVMQAYMDKLRAFHPPSYAEATRQPYIGWLRDRGVANTFSLLMFISAVLSFLAIVLIRPWR